MEYEEYVRKQVAALDKLSDKPRPWLAITAGVCFFAATVIVVGTILSHWLVMRGLNIGVN